MSSALSMPTYDQVINAIRSAGSSNEHYFGFPERSDGLYLQQDPEEYASFVHFMINQVKPAKLSLEIGIASGGQTKFLRDYWRAEKTIIVDIGQHEKFPHWQRIRPMVNTDIVCEIIDDSHSPSVRERLKPYFGKVDFAFIDGDHSYRGLRQDIFLAKDLMMPGALMVLHDTAAVYDCKRVFDDLTRSKDFVLVRNFQQRFGISVWKLLQVRRPPNAFNRWSGLGRL
ncbi:MAG: class I SAM-dependent methyltransferase [Hyphomicrobiaceae bacterium]|nr:class I SAM-dependent methyltransferase [Hyphomicrobiaceae bacterium]